MKSTRSCTDLAAFEKRLAAYALAGGAALSFQGVAQATPITYTGSPITVSSGDAIPSYGLDLNGDSTIDFTLAAYYTPQAATISGVDIIAPAGNGFTNSYGKASPVKAGATISGTNSFQTGTGILIEHKNFPKTGGAVTIGKWANVSPAYLGLQFDISGQTHYGWAHVDAAANGAGASFTLDGWAYENVAGAPIQTPGQVPEPSSLALFALGAAGVAAWRRKKASRA